jgi:phospholipid/cholesterol/gamma-HCH transport system substrate-binding protein
MDERVIQFRVGVMVLATIIITGILIVLFNRDRLPTFGKGTYTIQVRFPTAPGVAENTPVRRSGILIGRVSEVRFDENYNVIATLKIDGDHTIFESDHIRIMRSLLGDAELEVVRQTPPQAPGAPHEAARPEIPASEPTVDESRQDQNGTPPGSEVNDHRRKRFVLTVLRISSPSPAPVLAVLQPGSAKKQPPIRDAQPPAPDPAAAQRRQQPPPADVPVQPGVTIQGRVTTTPLESFEDLRDDFQQAAKALSNAGNEVGTLSRNLNDLFQRNEKQIDRIITQTDQALSSFQRAMEGVNEILGDAELRDNVKQALRDLPKMLQETQRAIAGIEGAMRLVESNLKNLEGITEPLGRRGEAIVENIDSGIATLNQLLGQVEQFSRSLNSRQGTLGQLINNPEIYHQLSEAAANVNELTKELRPIIKDARIFTDKIARHPGVIIRDAVKPGSGTKWVTE